MQKHPDSEHISAAEPSPKGPKVLIAGMGVTFHRADGRLLVRGSQWQMLNLFTSLLGEVRFAATEDFGASIGTHDIELPPSTDYCFLNRAQFSRWGRVLNTPRLYGTLAYEVSRATMLYARLPSWSGLAACRMARLQKLPYFVSLHGHWDMVFRNRVKAHGGLYNAAMARYVDKATRATVAASEHTFFVGGVLAEKYARDSRASTVFANCLHTQQSLWPSSPPVIGERVRLLSVGELSQAKGTRLLVQALRQLLHRGINAELAFVGVGPDGEWLAQREREPELQGRIHLLGWKVVGEELDAEYRAADMLVLGSYAEGVPKVVLEAMVRGKPVVAARVGDVPWLLGNQERGWLFEPGDANGLAEAVEDAASSQVQRDRRVAQARLFVQQHDRTWALQQIRGGLVRLGLAPGQQHD